LGEFLESAVTTNINGLGSVGTNGFIDSRRDSVGMFIQVQVSQHHDRRQEHSSRVGRVLVLDIKSDMATSLLSIELNTCIKS
jgi:hypothetical protein